MSRRYGRFLRQNTIALLALFLALGGTSFAAASLINGSQIKKHTIAKNRLTNKAIKQLKGNRGAQGAQGAQGAPGAPGAAGAQGIQGVQGPAGPGARWAAVAPDATIARQSGGITVSNLSPGIYLVNFGVDISHQLILTSGGFYNDGSFRGDIIAGTCGDAETIAPGFCAAAGANPLTTVVLVTTNTANNTDENHGFFVSAVGPNGAGAPGANRAQHAVPGGLLPASRG